MTCSEFLKELTDYLDNTIDQRTRAELEEHLQWCHNCYVVCNTTKRTIEIYRDSQLFELPDDCGPACAPPSSASASNTSQKPKLRKHPSLSPEFLLGAR